MRALHKKLFRSIREHWGQSIAVVMVVGNPDGPRFTRGPATISAVILDEDTLTVHASDQRRVLVLGGHHQPRTP